MPLYEKGIFLPLEEYGETARVDQRVDDGEKIEERIVFSRRGDPLVLQHLRSNEEYDSDFQTTTCNFVESGVPVYSVEAAYWLQEDLSISVLYGETAEEHNDGVTEFHPFANITYYPDTASTYIESCEAEYGRNGMLTFLRLEAYDPYVSEGDDAISKTVKVRLLDNERVKQSIVGKDEEEEDAGIGAFGVPLRVSDGVAWTIGMKGSTVSVTAGIEELKQDFLFPATLRPSELKKVLEQKKPIKGVYRKSSPKEDIVEE